MVLHGKFFEPRYLVHFCADFQRKTNYYRKTEEGYWYSVSLARGHVTGDMTANKTPETRRIVMQKFMDGRQNSITPRQRGELLLPIGTPITKILFRVQY